MADENRATRSPPAQRSPGSALPASDQSWANQSKTERSDNSCNAARARRTWQINLSLQYLSHCVNKKPDVVCRRRGQDAVSQAANPPGVLPLAQRLEIAAQLLFKIGAFSQQQSLIKVSLHKAVRKHPENLVQVPAMIHPDTGEQSIREQGVSQMRRLRPLRVV